jgi:hypothetical protein
MPRANDGHLSVWMFEYACECTKENIEEESIMKFSQGGKCGAGQSHANLTRVEGKKLETIVMK